MKTFKEFCEQAYNPFLKSKPENPVSRFAKDVLGGIQSKLYNVNKKLTLAKFALGIHDPRHSYIQRHGLENDARFTLRGGNPDNPDKMPIVKPNPKIKYAAADKTIDSATINPSNKKGFGGRPTLHV